MRPRSVKYSCRIALIDIAWLQSPVSQVVQKPGNFVGRNWLAIQIALNLNAAFEIQTPHLFLGLNAFCGGDHAEAHAKSRDGAHYGEAPFVDEHISHKGLINLDLRTEGSGRSENRFDAVVIP